MRSYLGNERRGDRLLLFGTEDAVGCLAAAGERLMLLLALGASALEGFEGLWAGVLTANASSLEPRSAGSGLECQSLCQADNKCVKQQVKAHYRSAPSHPLPLPVRRA